MTRKTATIERYRAFGTPYENICVTYRGYTLNWWKDRCHVFAHTKYYGQESIDAMKEHAKRHGFTHVRFVGWTSNKPKGGKLK